MKFSLILYGCALFLITQPGFSVAVQNNPADKVELLQDTIVDEKALTFAKGDRTRFGTIINGRTHQQTPITTFNGYQYVIYYDANRKVCLGRRKLPRGKWEIIRFTDYTFKVNDSHNTAVLGICETDGTIHLAFDHHVSELHYRVSKPGVATQPQSFMWTASLFGPVTDQLGSAGRKDKVTYPRFFSAPNGNLMLYYRYVTSANGDGMIEEYNGEKQDWTPGLGRFIARDIGTYTQGEEVSNFRCPYLNSISYAGNRLHVSWIWRDRFENTDRKNNHDLCYAYSDDDGRTWNNSDGAVIGVTGSSSVISINSPGVHVAMIPPGENLSNQNTHYAYPDGSLHIVLPHKRKGTNDTRQHHYWRDANGGWHSEALPFGGSRPKLVGDSERNLFLVSTHQDAFLICQGIPNADQSGWTWTQILKRTTPSDAGEGVLDLALWEKEQVLAVYGQEAPEKTLDYGEQPPIDGIPTPLHVLYYRFK